MKKKIGFQGRMGAYSESACLHLFGEDEILCPYPTFDDVHQALADGEIDFAVLPFENSTTGSIHENFDLILKYQFSIYSEVIIQIEHTLMAPQGLDFNDIQEVRSHPQALAQCSQLFRNHPHLKAIPDFDTAGAAEKISQNPGTTAAIASELAAHEYGLNVLQRNVENIHDNNFTRFFCLGPKTENIALGSDKISLIYIPQGNHSGILYDTLGSFAKRKLDLVKIESRPRTGRPWEYTFYLDLLGNINENKVMEAIEEIKDGADEVVLLGNYPRGVTRKLFTRKKN